MHVVMTGATGLVGSAVLPRLLERGDRVTALVRSEDAALAVEHAGGSAVAIDFGTATRSPRRPHRRTA